MNKTIYLILAIILLHSCGERIPILDGEEPFVVESITTYNDTHCIYVAHDWNSGYSFWAMGEPQIILPTGLYQINDTISISPN